jgi:hypothetical protein
MIYEDICKVVSEETNIPINVIKEVYKSQFLFLRNKIQELPLKEISSTEDFEKLRTNFNLPSLGKFNCTYDHLMGMKRKYELINKLFKDDKSKAGETHV